MILTKYILKNHVAPFLFSIFTLIGIFLLQFLMKFADRLVGKGLGIWIITKLIIYNLAWMIVLVVPMSVLVATLMAFGGMAQNNEIAALKATGMSLYKMILPPLGASLLLALFLIYFNNNIYPDANHAARLLMEDISRQKPTLSLSPGVFSQDVPNYSILAREIDQENNTLKNITIYDYSNPPSINVVTAKSGVIYLSPNQKKLIMDLNEGEIHEFNNSNWNQYRRLRFSRHKIAMPAEQFTFEQSTPGGPRGDRELGAPQMLAIVDSLQKIRERYLSEMETAISKITYNESPIVTEKGADKIYDRVKQRLNNHKNILRNILNRLEYNKKEINRYWVEIHKKYALPFACIVFILIGAPLGTMTRKGGFGMAAGISLVFFLIYWTFLIGGEKLSDRGLLSPFWGIWSANILLGILGIILTIKSARERIELKFDFINKVLPKSWKYNPDENENS
ncbi:LptF/LptG family permease [Melioribacter sp. Ez-97]|uniref:LptF/LptG family permease n=1 Tax=Melioribacter sp. Ez-97 TaxID=3423434 RepID=UPI003EDAB996